MCPRNRSCSIILLGLILVGSSIRLTAADEQRVDFNRDVRPLLSDKCYACHGPDEENREAGLRLDSRESAFGEADSGETPIVPGDLKASELYARIASEDESLRMPPADSTKQLTKEEIDTIGRWIEQGAEWKGHWSFEPIARPEVPAAGEQSDWAHNEIDRFIVSRLATAKLKPSSRADKHKLIRRLTFDLTGLPPTLDEVDAFLADSSEEAYERLVDRLLKSPRYGEHMARYWLDAARYGDTHGLHLDNYREMWAYRDWVINAFNENMRFDQFTVEQIAGDLLPNPTDDQIIATGFNRCHVTTSEGGSIAEEVYVRNVVDRVVTTGTVFMGMTFECSRCHDHKYDPFTMNDFYSMFAFFNNLDANPLDGNKKDHAPVLKVLTSEQQAQIAELKQRIADAKADIARRVAAFNYVEPESPSEPMPAKPKEFVWIDDAVPAGAKAEGGWQFVDEPVFSGKKSSTRTATGLSQHFFTGASTPLRIAEGDTLFAYVFLDPQNPPKEIMLQWNDGSWDHRAFWGGDHIPWGTKDTPSRRHQGPLPAAGEWVRLEVPVAEVGLNPGAAVNGWAFTQFDGTVHWDKAGIVTLADQNPTYESLAAWVRDQHAAKGANLPPAIKTIVTLDAGEISPEQHQTLKDYFIEHAYAKSRDIFDPLHKQVAGLEKQMGQIENSAATTLVFRERNQPKEAYMLIRGEYDKRGDQVERRTPLVLPPMPEAAPMNRLGFARWLVDPRHPLTARVAVNRFWQQTFGVGLVKTAEDFGSQGDVPSHPELLDWLAAEFIDSGWDVKAIMKKIVMSTTYQQSSRLTPELVRRDPENRLLARGPRFRLDAEMLRDQALAVSGLLVNKLGGPSVKPPQPDGLWFAVGYSGSNTVRFQQDTGAEKVHRRTLYTFIKRTAPPPQMSTFDAPSRESCVMRRERTNTPLQALLLMNDPQFVEAARALAERAIREGGSETESRAVYMFRLCTARHPDAVEIENLRDVYAKHSAYFADNLDAAKNLVEIGESKPGEALEPAELAAWTMVANLVLNLDEVLTKN